MERKRGLCVNWMNAKISGLKSIGWGNDLVPAGNTPLPEPMVAHVYFAIRPHKVKISWLKINVYTESEFDRHCDVQPHQAIKPPTGTVMTKKISISYSSIFVGL